MKALLIAILVLSVSSVIVAQQPVPILRARWQRTTIPAPKSEVNPTSPAQPVIPENKYFQRKAREQRTDNPMDPNEATIEGRSAAMDKAIAESRAPRADDVQGYTYFIEVRNDTGMTVDIFFWEYEFTEIANPKNVVRRQFLCGVNLKDGERKELSAFSLLGPSDVIAIESLSKSDEKLFQEKTQINRIEFSDGNILQRHTWKYDDVKDAVARVTSTPWVNEGCRPL